MVGIYELNIMSKVSTKYADFYRKILRDEKLVDNMHQLFTYACLVGLKENRKSEGPKSDDIFTVGNINKNNLDVVKGVLLMKEEPEDADTLLKLMEDYADGGIEVLQKEFHNEGELSLSTYL